jgi:5,5'-dehydrodivanillate O-demethylase oxygenase subunit
MSDAAYAELVHTGPGTIAGRYLRRFWQPVYRSQDLASGQAVPIRIMSEDLTLYRGASGTPHLVAVRCAHRGTQLSTGWVEEDCLRCLYHGWKYDATGQCVEQPGEDEGFAAKVRIRSYPTQEYLGLVFAYLGQGEPPPLRRYPDFDLPGVQEVGPPEYWPCNYFNRIDNIPDAGHVIFTHHESIMRAGRPDRLTARSVHSEEVEYGTRTTIAVAGRPPEYLHFHMPNVNQVRAQVQMEGSLEDAASLWADRLFWRVPVDDEHCVSFVVELIHLMGEAAEAYQERRRQTQEAIATSPNEIAAAVLAGRVRLKDLDARLSTYKLFWVEDYVTQVGLGSIADRANERLGRMDTGVILLRKIWQRELRALGEGRPLTEWTTPAGLAEMHVPAPVAT